MDGDKLLESINMFIDRVNNIPAISAAGLKDTMFPDDIIASLHNHLGNIKHYVSDISAAFNASDQFIAISAAERELGDVGDNLLTLHQTSLITDTQYQYLSETLHGLDELFRQATDPEFM